MQCKIGNMSSASRSRSGLSKELRMADCVSCFVQLNVRVKDARAGVQACILLVIQDRASL